jgi:RsiW-degrading membrane proteinase PrsW (M82 family)
MLLVLVVSLSFGAVVTTQSLFPTILLPPIHAVAMGLPPLILLWLTGRALRGSGGSWREVVASIGGGGLLGTTLSFAAEAILVIAVAVVAALALLAVPGGPKQLSELVSSLREPMMLDDASSLLKLLANPAVALASVGVLGVAVPLIEESLKTLAVGVAGAWVRPHRGRAFLWGVASGTGFAIVESLLNGAMAGQEGWIYGAFTRGAASVMHCFTGGLVGWAWGRLWEGRRVLRFLASLAGAVVIHGLWNTIAVALVALAAVSDLAGPEAPWQLASSAGIVVLASLLGVLATGLAVSLPVIGRRLAAGYRPAPTEVAVPITPSPDPRADG